MRGDCKGMRSELDRRQHEGADRGLRRGYSDGPGRYGAEYCREGPSEFLFQYEDGYSDGAGFEE